jgi:hypothetical protein
VVPVTSSESRLKTALWPSIPDVEAAQRIAKQGFWAALFVAGVTAVFGILAIFGMSIAGIDATALIAAAVFLGIAWGIRKMSRTAAIAAFLLFLADRILMWLENQRAGGWLVAIFVALAFLNAVRATFVYHRLTSRQVPEATAGITEPR